MVWLEKSRPVVDSTRTYHLINRKGALAAGAGPAEPAGARDRGGGHAGAGGGAVEAGCAIDAGPDSTVVMQS